MSGRFPGSDMVGPEYVRSDCRPSADFAVASLHNRVPDGAMLTLNDAIGAGVIGGYADVGDAIPSLQPIERGDEGCTVICNDLLDTSPSAQNLFEHESTQCAASLAP